MKTRPYRRGLLIYPPHCALLFIAADERPQNLWANNPSDAQPAVFSFCCRRRIFDSWVLLWRCRAALEVPHLMSRFITAFPPLLMPATWWFITVLQPPLTLITSRFIHLGGAFLRSALLPFLSSNASGFQLAKAVLFRSALGASRGFKADIYMRIYRYICIYYCHMHIVILLYIKHQ